MGVGWRCKATTNDRQIVLTDVVALRDSRWHQSNDLGGANIHRGSGSKEQI